MITKGMRHSIARNLKVNNLSYKILLYSINGINLNDLVFLDTDIENLIYLWYIYAKSSHAE